MQLYEYGIKSKITCTRVFALRTLGPAHTTPGGVKVKIGSY